MIDLYHLLETEYISSKDSYIFLLFISLFFNKLDRGRLVMISLN